MIAITRSNAPTVLGPRGSKAVDRYRNEEVVAALHKMQKGKCCYCEAYLPAEGHSKAVEHFRPKAVFKNKTNDWKNLLLCCPQCNGKKNDQFPVVLNSSDSVEAIIYLDKASSEKPAILNPCEAPDPEEHLSYEVADSSPDYGQIRARGNSLLGRTTIEVVGLYRAFYTEAHFDHLIVLQRTFTSLLVAKRLGNEAEVKNFEGEFRMMIGPEHKFSALSREFARSKDLAGKGFDVSVS